MKPSWDDAPDWAQWLAMDMDEVWFWHQTKPEKSNGYWSSSGRVANAGEVPAWDRSRERRPMTPEHSYGPACDDCGASAGAVSGNIEENIAAWNTRAELNKSAQTWEQAACAKILAAVRAYLPPGGLTKDELISRVIEAVDNPEFNAGLKTAEPAEDYDETMMKLHAGWRQRLDREQKR